MYTHIQGLRDRQRDKETHAHAYVCTYVITHIHIQAGYVQDFAQLELPFLAYIADYMQDYVTRSRSRYNIYECAAA